MVDAQNEPSGNIYWVVVESKVQWHPKYWFSNEINRKKIKRERTIYTLLPRYSSQASLLEGEYEKELLNSKEKAIAWAEYYLHKRFNNITIVLSEVFEWDYGAEYYRFIYYNPVPIVD